MVDTFIMNETGWILCVQIIVHLMKLSPPKDSLPRDQIIMDGWFLSRCNIELQRSITLAVHSGLLAGNSVLVHFLLPIFPAAVSFQIRFVDDIQAIFIAQIVPEQTDLDNGMSARR